MGDSVEADGFKDLSPEELQAIKGHVKNHLNDDVAEGIIDDVIPGIKEEDQKPDGPESEEQTTDPFDEFKEPPTPSVDPVRKQRWFEEYWEQVVKWVKRIPTILKQPNIRQVLYFLLVIGIGLLLGWLLIPKPPPIIL